MLAEKVPKFFGQPGISAKWINRKWYNSFYRKNIHEATDNVRNWLKTAAMTALAK